MFILLIVIAILANVLIGTADISLLRWKKKNDAEKKSITKEVVVLSIVLTMFSPSIFAQDSINYVPTPSTIGGLSPAVFYIMITIIFLELSVILALLTQCPIFD